LNLGANGIDTADPIQAYGLNQLLYDDIFYALEPSGFFIEVYQVTQGSKTKVTVWFVNTGDSTPNYNGDVRLAQRDALRMQIEDLASLYRTTVTGQYADASSYSIQDSPATPAGALSIVPSIFTLCLALLATIVGRV